jgi:hypothetical protein
MGKGNPRRVIRASKTVLIVGEGDADKAFLNYLKSLYVTRRCGVSVTIRNAFGKDPDNVVETVIGQSRNAKFDLKAALLDTDLPWTPALMKKVRQNQIHLIGSRPCLEGLLLNILRQHVPEASNECKTRLHSQLGGNPTEPGSYAPLFVKALLEDRCGAIVELNNLLRLFGGRKPEY